MGSVSAHEGNLLNAESIRIWQLVVIWYVTVSTNRRT